MSETSAESAPPPAGPPTACSVCTEPLRSVFYRSGEAVFCPTCRVAAGTIPGTPRSRLLRALAFGGAAALLSAILWYAVIVWTDREFGLLAIGVGLLVGGAVRFGAHRRGGWGYQTLAIVLTYTAIVTSYVPLIVQAAMAEAESPTGIEEGTVPVDAGELDVDFVAAESARPADGDAPAGADLTADADAFDPPVGTGDALLALGMLAGLLFAAPFLAGPENFMGWVILAIALYEAWKLNRREELPFEGPLYLPGHRAPYQPEPPPPPIAP